MIQIGGADKIDILKSITHDIIITLHTNVESDVTTLLQTNSNAEHHWSELYSCTGVHCSDQSKVRREESLEQKMWALKNKVSSFGELVQFKNYYSLSIYRNLVIGNAIAFFLSFLKIKKK